MKNITKNLMSATLGVALLAGSLGFSSTIEASPHNNMVYMDAGEPRPPEPPEQRYHSHHRPGPQDDQRGPGTPPPPPPYDDQGGPDLPPPPDAG
jgi:hypothetical protein